MKAINHLAPVKCSRSIVIDASIEHVWDVLTDIDQWTNWQSDIARAQLNGPLQPNTTFDWKTGGAAIHSTLHTVESHYRLGWTGRTFGLFAIHNWTLSRQGNATLVVADESMEGWLARFLRGMFNKNLEKQMVQWLALLKQTCEAKG